MNLIRFALGLFRNMGCLIGLRHKVWIIISKGDASLPLNKKKLSPIALSLGLLLSEEGIPSSTWHRDVPEITGFRNFQKSLFYFFRLGIKFGLSNKTVWKLLFKVNKPRFVVCIDWDPSLNFVCNLLKIPVYYIQHGVLCEDHRIMGRKVMENIPSSELPTGFLCWDNPSSDNFKGIINTFTIGHIWYSLMWRDNSFEIINQIKKEYTFDKISKSSLPKILMTLTYNNPEYEDIPVEIIRFIKESKGKFFWMVRPHPVVCNSNYKKSGFEKFLKENFHEDELEYIEWQTTSSFPLPLILKETDLHITIESSSVIEAAYSGIHSLMLNEKVIENYDGSSPTGTYGGPSYFLAERQNGYVTIKSDDLSIQEWIESKLNFKRSPQNHEEFHRIEWERFLKKL